MSVQVSLAPEPPRSPIFSDSTLPSELNRSGSSLLISKVAPAILSPSTSSPRPLVDSSSYSPFPTIPGSGHSRDPFGLNAYLLHPQDTLWDYMEPSQSVQPGLDAVEAHRFDAVASTDMTEGGEEEEGVGVKLRKRKSFVKRASTMMFRRSSPLTIPAVFPNDELAENDDDSRVSAHQVIEQPPKAKQRSPGRRSLRRVLRTRRQSEPVTFPSSPVPELFWVPPVPDILVKHRASHEEGSLTSTSFTSMSSAVEAASSTTTNLESSPLSSYTSSLIADSKSSTPISSRSQSNCSAISSASSDSSDGIRTPRDEFLIDRQMVGVDLATVLESAEAASRKIKANLTGGNGGGGGWRSWLGGKRGSKSRESTGLISTLSAKSGSTDLTSPSPANSSPEFKSFGLDPSPDITVSRSRSSTSSLLIREPKLPPETPRTRSAQHLRRISMCKLYAMRTPSPHPLAHVLLRQYSNLPGEVASSIPASRRVFPRSVNSHQALIDSHLGSVGRGELRMSLAIQAVVYKVDQGVLPEILMLNLNSRTGSNSRSTIGGGQPRPRGVRDFISRPTFEERNLVYYGNDTYSHVSMAHPGNAVWELEFSSYIKALSKVEEPPAIGLDINEGKSPSEDRCLGVPVPCAPIVEGEDEVDEVPKGVAANDRLAGESRTSAGLAEGNSENMTDNLSLDSIYNRLPKIDSIQSATAAAVLEMQSTEEIADDVSTSAVGADYDTFPDLSSTSSSYLHSHSSSNSTRSVSMQPPNASSFRRSVAGNRSPKMWESSDDSDDERLSVTLSKSKRVSKRSGGFSLHRAKSEVNLLGTRSEQSRSRTQSQPEVHKKLSFLSTSNSANPSLTASILTRGNNQSRPQASFVSSLLPPSRYLNPDAALEQITQARERRDEFLSGELARRVDAEKIREQFYATSGIINVNGNVPLSLAIPSDSKTTLLAKRRSSPNLIGPASVLQAQILSPGQKKSSRSQSHQGSSLRTSSASTTRPEMMVGRRRVESYYETSSHPTSHSSSINVQQQLSRPHMPRPSSYYDLSRNRSVEPSTLPSIPTLPNLPRLPTLTSGLSLSSSNWVLPYSQFHSPAPHSTGYLVPPHQAQQLHPQSCSHPAMQQAWAAAAVAGAAPFTAALDSGFHQLSINGYIYPPNGLSLGMLAPTPKSGSGNASVKSPIGQQS